MDLAKETPLSTTSLWRGSVRQKI